MFYEGDTMKLITTLKPALYKFWYWENSKTKKYQAQGQMTFEQVIAYSKSVLEKKEFLTNAAPEKVEVLDIMNHIAAAKVTVWWGSDYLLLTKNGDKWMIDQMLWEEPLEERNP